LRRNLAQPGSFLSGGHGRSPRKGSDDFDGISGQSGEGGHALVDEDTQIGLDRVGKEAGESQNAHTLPLGCGQNGVRLRQSAGCMGLAGIIDQRRTPDEASASIVGQPSSLVRPEVIGRVRHLDLQSGGRRTGTAGPNTSRKMFNYKYLTKTQAFVFPFGPPCVTMPLCPL
jgi:hypothetical protein